MFYICILPGPYRTGSDKTDVWVGESPLSCLSREDVVKDIYTGQWSPPVRVLQIDEEAGTVTDVTKDIAEEVGQLSYNDLEPPYEGLDDWLENNGAHYFKMKMRGWK